MLLRDLLAGETEN